MTMPNVSVNSVQLPPDLVWVDEHEWSPVVKKASVSVTGSTIVSVGVRQSGRPVTLESGSDFAWVTRQALDSLTALRAADTKPLTLTLGDGRQFQVEFAPTDESPLKADPVQPGKRPEPGDLFKLKLKFMTV